MSDKQPDSGRRGFFRKLLLHGLEAAEEAGRQMTERVTNQLENAGLKDPKPAFDYSSYQSEYVRYLRPPGALAEWEMADTCSQCGLCVDACPADAIKLDPDKAGGLPFIVAREQPCVVCDDLACMKVCPTGALKPVEKPEQIDMGMAIVDQHTCVRSEWNHTGVKEDCKVCLEVCPFGESAIGLDAQDMIEVRDACTGCGICEKNCPTDPTSIWVEESYDPAHDAMHHYHDDWDHDDWHGHHRRGRARLLRLGRLAYRAVGVARATKKRSSFSR